METSPVTSQTRRSHHSSAFHREMGRRPEKGLQKTYTTTTVSQRLLQICSKCQVLKHHRLQLTHTHDKIMKGWWLLPTSWDKLFILAMQRMRRGGGGTSQNELLHLQHTRFQQNIDCSDTLRLQVCKRPITTRYFSEKCTDRYNKLEDECVSSQKHYLTKGNLETKDRIMNITKYWISFENT